MQIRVPLIHALAIAAVATVASAQTPSAPTAPAPRDPAVPGAPAPMPATAPVLAPAPSAAPSPWAIGLDAPVALDAAHWAAEVAPLALESAQWALAELPHAMEALDIGAGVRAFHQGGPQQGWAPSDPADSLYRIARETLNRSEYRRAAQLFREMREKFPRSEYVSEAAYWEAFSLYRVGTTEDLRSALRVLDQQATFTRKETEANARALSARVLGALARRGDAAAQQRVAIAARNGTQACDSEDLMVRVEALNALSQLDQAAATPLLKKVLAKRDDCSAPLRRGAVTLVARRGGPDALAMLREAAISDPSSSVRSVAAANIAQLKGDDATAALEQMLRSNDDGVRRSAARALAGRGDARSRAAVRAYLESPQVSESQKAQAILNFERETSTADDAAYLRALYSRTDSERIRGAIISIMPRLNPEAGRVWLAGIARDASQPTSVRSTAISTLSRDRALPVAELIRMYDAANERRIRDQVVIALGRRDEPEATEKLIEIARNGTDPVIRNSAIGALARKKDPRLAQVLRELIDR